MMTPHHKPAAMVALGLALAALVLAAPDLLAAQNTPADREQEVIRQGYRINPVPLRHRPAALRSLVGLGSYIVNTSGCNDCHTNPPYAEGGDPFLGQPEQINVEGFLAGGVEFGPFVSRNLTPDQNGRPAGLTWPQFRDVLRTGVDVKQAHPQLGPLLQVMPWPVFGKKTTYELFATYQYLKSIPSIPGQTPFPSPVAAH